MTIFDEMDNLLVMCEAIGTAPDVPEPEPLDPERFKAYAKSPNDIDEQTMRDIAAVIDGKLNVTPPSDNTVPVATPSTLDRLLNSVTVIYITDKDFPVAAANLVDPTVENFRGIVPLRYYSLLSGYNLDGRVQQEFFAVADEYRNAGVGKELRAQIDALGTPTFIVADSTDKEAVDGLARNGYTLVGQMEEEGAEVPVQLWIDNAGKAENKPQATEETEENDIVSLV